MKKKSTLGRPISRIINDSERSAAEKGLPIGEKRYSTVYNIDQLDKLKALVKELAAKTDLKKVGNVPPIQLKILIYEAINDLLVKYQKKGKRRITQQGKENMLKKYLRSTF